MAAGNGGEGMKDQAVQETEQSGSWMDNGEWVAMTLGELISLMIDGGGSDIVFVRVTGQTPVQEGGNFQLFLETHLVPNGEVLKHAEEIGCKKFDKRRLIPMIEKGVVK
jgi:hypothetical protein